jgi:xanthine dehydrogenase YagR molybdenum-binding subunit
MATWPENPRLIGTRIPRLDGLLKASGKAKYPSDVRPEGTLFGVMLYSPYARAKIKSIDTSAAEKMPGVKAVIKIAGDGAPLNFHGDDIAAVAAETENQARDAIRAIKIEYEVLPHVATEALSMAEGAPKVFDRGNVTQGRTITKGTPDEKMATAEVIIEGTYSVPMITHVCLETHGLTVKFEGADKMECWASTQSVTGVAGELAGLMKIPTANVTVHTDYMGGGFGSKFGADIWGQTAARLSKLAGGRPVKMFLDRVQEHLAAGNRPSASAHIKLGANRDGTIVSMIANAHGTGGVGGSGNVTLPYVYSIADTAVTQSAVRTNFGNQRAMRAPGHPQSCALTEAAMDDLADKLGMDPVEFRLKNLNPTDFHTPWYQAELKMGAELIGWSEKRKPRGRSGPGPIKHGMGVALHQWGGGPSQRDKKVSCTINPDGSVETQCATQDLGTGIRTVLAIIAAELLGLNPTDITSSIGNSHYPPGQASGGSTTTPCMSPPAYDAVTKARDAFFKKIAPAVEAAPEKLSLRDGQLWNDGKPVMSWKDACRKLGMSSVSETGTFQDGLASGGVAGCQFAEVSVDVETGVVKVKKIVAIQDSGLIIDMLTWESQVYGGVIMGLNYGLFEERVVDPTTGTMLNPDMELYKLAGAADIPEIIVKAYEPSEIKARGVSGIGEPPTISTAAAIGNAVANAIGVRVPEWPMSPRNVLNALATASREGKA